jgi:FtsZ-interacting cell division protein ZipA
MSDLQLSLMGIGVMVIAGVAVFNWIQERKFRKMAQARFQAPREDVLMDRGPDTESRMTLDQVRVEPVRLEPRIEPHLEAATPIDEAVAPSPIAERTRETAHDAIPAPIDPAIDFIVRLDLSEPMSASVVRTALESTHGEKAVHWQGHGAADGWSDLAKLGDMVSLSAVMGGLQLADRSGALNGVQLSAFSSEVQQAAESLIAVTQLGDRQSALDSAGKLDAFCADVDILVGVNIVALEQNVFAGTKVRALAEAAGLTLSREGTYQQIDDKGHVLYVLTNQESAPFRAEDMKSLSTHGLTLLFEVPRVANGVRVFDQMIAFAHQLADALRGLMVDDNLRPLSDEGIAKIKQQLSLVYGKMDKSGIPAGSPRALRLFS